MKPRELVPGNTRKIGIINKILFPKSIEAICFLKNSPRKVNKVNYRNIP